MANRIVAALLALLSNVTVLLDNIILETAMNYAAFQAIRRRCIVSVLDNNNFVRPSKIHRMKRNASVTGLNKGL